MYIIINIPDPVLDVAPGSSLDIMTFVSFITRYSQIKLYNYYYYSLIFGIKLSFSVISCVRCSVQIIL